MGLVRIRLPEKYARVWAISTNGSNWSNTSNTGDAERKEKYMIGVTVKKVTVKKGNAHIQTVDYVSCPKGRHVDVYHEGLLICRIERKHTEEETNKVINEIEAKWIRK